MQVGDVAPSFLNHTHAACSPLNHTYGDDPEPEEASEERIASDVWGGPLQHCATGNSSALEATKGHKGVAPGILRPLLGTKGGRGFRSLILQFLHLFFSTGRIELFGRFVLGPKGEI